MNRKWYQTDDSVQISMQSVTGLVAKDWSASMILDQLNEIDQKIESRNARTYLEGRNLVAGIDLKLPEGVLAVVVKRFPRPQPFRRLLYSWIYPSKAFRSWIVANTMLKYGLSTPRPLAVLHDRQDSLGKSYFITEEIRGGQTLRDWRRDPRRTAAEIEEGIGAVATFVRRFHDAGLYHPDLTAGNFLLRQESTLAVAVYLVDLNRARIKKAVSIGRRLKDLARLKICNCKTEIPGEKFWRLGCGLWTPCEKMSLLRAYFREESTYQRYKRKCWTYQASALLGFRVRRGIRKGLSLRRRQASSTDP